VAEVVEHLPSKHTALCSNTRTERERFNLMKLEHHQVNKT
jgi:hypothetical protein